jgi:DNA-3-methyladenine glycosylase II
VATLKSVGLSTRKAEYVLDLAQRFADGRLSTRALATADDNELAELLIAVRGIGQWTGECASRVFSSISTNSMGLNRKWR